MPDFDVVDLGPTNHPESGDETPDFTRPLVTDEFWEDRSLSNVVADERRTILVFTPMVGSFASKYIYDELTEREWFDRTDRVVGVTASTPYAVSDFLGENEYPVSIFADPSNDVAESYGIAHDIDGMEGISEPRIAIFTLASDLTVEHSWVATGWPEFPPYDDLESELDLA